ncbi:MAG: 16S rRNA (cytidine(1402)-2'-O)-methyltransferase [Thermovirgaceae bacterium]|nr:16S rRNA (cytidine(1402)-2'-O)-methyltransferase [Thermovirgaceae bacterium]
MPLIVVPTPVGNMEDITLRALRVLREADIIACEDTRRTKKILSRYNIRTPLISCHAFNERERAETLLERLGRGETVALVSDAGTPGISDPGFEMIRRAREADFVIDVLPGATAFVPALLLSGFPPQPFFFEGFLPKKRGERRRRIEYFRALEGCGLLYLSPHGAESVVIDLIDILGDREAALVREISKIFQESISGTLSTILGRIRDGSVRGEMVLVLGPAAAGECPPGPGWEDEAGRLCADGLTDREVVKKVSEEYGIAKNTVKRFLHCKERDQGVS